MVIIYDYDAIHDARDHVGHNIGPGEVNLYALSFRQKINKAIGQLPTGDTLPRDSIHQVLDTFLPGTTKDT